MSGRDVLVIDVLVISSLNAELDPKRVVPRLAHPAEANLESEPKAYDCHVTI